MPTSADGTWGG